MQFLMRQWKRSIASVLCLVATAAWAQVPYKIVTASARGTYIQIGRDLAKFVAPDAGIDLEAVPSAGSAENVQRLRHEPGVKFALVQSDVYQAFLDQAAGGNAEAREMIVPLRLIMPWPEGARCISADGERAVSGSEQEIATQTGETIRLFPTAPSHD